MRTANPIHTISGIINGSTNFVLTKIFNDGLSLKDALNKAFDLGYLETGSTDDMDGLDLLRKINILSMLSYQTYIDEKAILNMPLSRVSETFITYVKSKGYVLKYIAYSHRENEHITIYVSPMIIKPSHLYNHIQNEYNIIEILGSYHEKQSFIGQGAGRYPTASAVVYDILHLKDTQS